MGSAEELVWREEVDLVVVAVKVPHHRELILPALEAGKMVLCEWPLGNGLAEAEELVAVAEAKGVRTFVGLQARSAPPVRYVRDVIADCYVGEVLSTSVIASAVGWGAEFAQGDEHLLDRDNGATMPTIPFGHTIDADTAPKELSVPSSYSSLAQLDTSGRETWHPVAHAYEQIRTDLTLDTRHAPDFAHAAGRHRLLDRIQRAAGAS